MHCRGPQSRHPIPWAVAHAFQPRLFATVRIACGSDEYPSICILHGGGPKLHQVSPESEHGKWKSPCIRRYKLLVSIGTNAIRASTNKTCTLRYHPSLGHGIRLPMTRVWARWQGYHRAPPGTTPWVEARCGQILDDELWAVFYIRDSGDGEKKAPRALRLSGPLLCKTPYEVLTTYKRTDCADSQLEAAAVVSACWASIRNVRIWLQIAEIAE